jgi:hypothetical protein
MRAIPMPNFLNKSFLLAGVQGIAAAARRLSNLQQLRFVSWLFSDARGAEDPKIHPRPSFREQNAERNFRKRIAEAASTMPASWKFIFLVL